MNQPAKKATKEQARYRDFSVTKNCEDCTMFVLGKVRGPSGCTAVEGEISPVGTCRYFERKGGKRA